MFNRDRVHQRSGVLATWQLLKFSSLLMIRCTISMMSSLKCCTMVLASSLLQGMEIARGKSSAFQVATD